MSNILEAYVVGARTWHEDKELGWISGELTAKHLDDDKVTLEFKDDKDKVRVAPPPFPSLLGRVFSSTSTRTTGQKGHQSTLES